MDLQKTFENRESPIELGKLVEISETLYEYYKTLNDEITQEFILVNIIKILNDDKKRRNITYNKSINKDTTKYIELSNALIQRRLGIQSAQSIILSLIVSVVGYFLLSNFLKLSLLMSVFLSIIIFILFSYSFFKSNSRRLIENSKFVYKQKADKRVLDFFKFYLS